MIYDFEGDTPKIDPGSWVASNAVIIGKVELKKNSNIWFNTTLRGDLEPIVIGEWFYHRLLRDGLLMLENISGNVTDHAGMKFGEQFGGFFQETYLPTHMQTHRRTDTDRES